MGWLLRDVKQILGRRKPLGPREVFLSLLTEEMRHSYLETGAFNVRGSNGGLYRIHHGFSSNCVELHEDGRRYRGWCAYPLLERRPSSWDVSDSHCFTSMTAQMLMIQTDEDEYRDTAL